ncbi:zinc finger AN1-like family protein, partial [Prunus dulcis]
IWVGIATSPIASRSISCPSPAIAAIRYFVWSIEAILSIIVQKLTNKMSLLSSVPLCKGVHLIPDEDANITWERHVNTEYATLVIMRRPQRRKSCRDCTVNHCLKHQFGPDHKCPGPKKQTTSFPFSGLLSRSMKEVSKPNHAPAASSSNWTNLARSGKLQRSRNGQLEKCPQCGAKFSLVTTLVDHVEKVHEKGGDRAGVKKATELG